MLVLEQEFRNWANRLRGGDNDFLLVARDRDNRWQCVFNKSVEPIESIRIESDYCTVYEYDWFGEYPEDQFFWCAMLINKAGGLLCKDYDGFYGLCIKEDNAPIESFHMSFRTETIEFHYEYKSSKSHIKVYHLSDNDGPYGLPSKKAWIRV
jgi:hypothetical protein